MKDTIDATVQVVRKISAELRPGVLDGFGLRRPSNGRPRSFRTVLEYSANQRHSEDWIWRKGLLQQFFGFSRNF